VTAPGGVHAGEPFVVSWLSVGAPAYVLDPPPLPAVGALDGLSDVDGAAGANPGNVLVKDSDGVWRPEPGGSLSGGVSYHHNQLSADEVWTILHSLGFFPGGITAYDSINDIIEPADIIHVDTDTTVLLFTGRPMSGYADLS
jgi:hypothetical protein